MWWLLGGQVMTEEGKLPTPRRSTPAAIARRLSDRPAAPLIAELLERFLGSPLPFGIRAWDSSITAPPGAPVVLVNSPRALRRLALSPNELGIARCYVTGEIDIEGDFASGLAEIWGTLRARRTGRVRPKLSGISPALALALMPGALGLPPRRPASEARIGGVLHSPGRDRSVIHHHYDLSNAFYEILLDKTMAYSCAYWTSDLPGYGLAEAQLDKLDLICRKLGLHSGSRLVDIGCGWGSLAIHAAHHYGASVLAVTLSANQAEYVTKRAMALGLTSQIEVRLADYREIGESGADAVASIEMGEHVGRQNYPLFVASLAAMLAPGGRLLLQQMSRPEESPGGGPFIEAYIAPDMDMRPVGETISLLEEATFEIRDVEALREHYARTIWAWVSVLNEREDELTALVGSETIRVWRLYLTAAALGFESGRSGVDQILAVRPNKDGRVAMDLTRQAWSPNAADWPRQISDDTGRIGRAQQQQARAARSRGGETPDAETTRHERQNPTPPGQLLTSRPLRANTSLPRARSQT